jgi:hypothetical protein
VAITAVDMNGDGLKDFITGNVRVEGAKERRVLLLNLRRQCGHVGLRCLWHGAATANREQTNCRRSDEHRSRQCKQNPAQSTHEDS